MAVRILWDCYEVALLFSAYERVAKGADIGIEAAKLSETLRALAIRRGVSIDDTYRNINGMRMQLASVQYLFTDGKKGLRGASAMIRRMYELYRDIPAEYQKILKEANRMAGITALSVEDAFFAYAKDRISLPPAMLASYLKKAADYCHLKQPLLGMMDVKAVRDVQQKVAEGRLLCFQYGKDAQAIRIVTQLYYTFIKSYRGPKEKLRETPVEGKAIPAETVPVMDTTGVEPASGPQTAVIAEISGEDPRKSNIAVLREDTEYLKGRKSELNPASSWAEYEAVLKCAFPKGFQKESSLDIKKLRKRWAEIHGEELKDSDETIRLQLAAHCVDTGKRWYLSELLLSDKDRQTVLQYIDRVLSNGKPVLYYSSIYAALEHQLESTILTEGLLASYLRVTCRDRYILREHYLSNDRNAQVDVSQEIKDVMLAYGRPIHTDELKRALHHLPPDQVERELHMHSEFIMDAYHMYFHESMADLTDQELDQIGSFIQEELDDQGYMIGDWIQRKLEQRYPETAERLSFLTLLGVRGAVAYKLRYRFTFSGPVITPKGKAMNMIDIFAMFCQRHTPFTLEELSDFAKECDSMIYMDTVHEHCARVSENDFVAAGAVRWDVPHIDAVIALYCPGKYMSLKDIRYFDAFPYVGYPWNSYLLEQYVATVSEDFMLMHSSYAKKNTSGAIVRRDAGFESFDEVLTDILANAPVDLEKDPCLEYLVNSGYITRKKLSDINEIITRAKMLRSQKG